MADKLERARDAVRNLRDLELGIQNLEAKLADAKKQQLQITRNDLPDLFNELGIAELTLQKEGNMPAYTAKLKPFFTAGIAASWPEEKREEAFAYLTSIGAQDLIKTKI